MSDIYQAAKDHCAKHPYWHKLRHTIWENDVPVMLAEFAGERIAKAPTFAVTGAKCVEACLERVAQLEKKLSVPPNGKGDCNE